MGLRAKHWEFGLRALGFTAVASGLKSPVFEVLHEP